MATLMENEIKRIKEQNGNKKYKSDELLWYAIAKLDKIDDKLDNKASKAFVWKVFGILFTLIMFILGVIVVM